MEIRIWYVYRFKGKGGNIGYGDTPQEAIVNAIDSYGYSNDKRCCKFDLFRKGSRTEGFHMTMLKGSLIGSYNAKKIMERQLRALG